MDKNYTKSRLREIVSVSLKHGIKSEIRNPKELRLVLEELGPTFVKIGQILSMRPNILPREYIHELQKLQDNVKSESFETMKGFIEEEINDSISNVFIEFNETPIASASMAEVYFAKLYNGEKVVVKIQRPNIDKKFSADIRILKKLSPFINFVTQGEVVDIKQVVNELERAAKSELNFIEEMDNIIRFSENNKDVKFIKCPKVYEKYCSKKVLVMEYIDGIKINNTKKLIDNDYDISDMATKLTYNYMKQILEDGFFHADPHPGNLFIYGNKITYIDFGLMGSLNSNLQKRLNETLEAMVTGNIDLMVKAIIKMGDVKGPIDMEKLHEDIDSMYTRYIDEAIYDLDISVILEEIFSIAKKNNIYIPENVVLLGKGLMIIQGVLAEMDKDLNIMDVALPYFEDQILQKGLKNIDWNQMIVKLYSSVRSSVELSTKSLKLVENMIEGKINLNLQLKNLGRSFDEINKMVNRIIFAVIIAGLLISSSLVVNANVGLKIYGISSIGIIGYLGAGIAGILLLISIYRSSK